MEGNNRFSKLKPFPELGEKNLLDDRFDIIIPIGDGKIFYLVMLNGMCNILNSHTRSLSFGTWFKKIVYSHTNGDETYYLVEDKLGDIMIMDSATNFLLDGFYFSVTVLSKDTILVQRSEGEYNLFKLSDDVDSFLFSEWFCSCSFIKRDSPKIISLYSEMLMILDDKKGEDCDDTSSYDANEIMMKGGYILRKGKCRALISVEGKIIVDLTKFSKEKIEKVIEKCN